MKPYLVVCQTKCATCDAAFVGEQAIDAVSSIEAIRKFESRALPCGNCGRQLTMGPIMGDPVAADQIAV
jgi:hypothetical protein